MLCIASLATSNEVAFDWELLNSGASVQEKYEHIIQVDTAALANVRDSGDLAFYMTFYANVTEFGKNIKVLNLLKSITAKFQESDPQARTVLGVLYHYQDNYIFVDHLKNDKNAFRPENKKFMEVYYQTIYSEEEIKARRLYDSACNDHYLQACIISYFSEPDKVTYCFLNNSDGNPSACDLQIQSMAQVENRLLNEAIYNYSHEKDESIKQALAYVIHNIYKQGFMPFAVNEEDHKNPENMRRYGFTRDAKKAELWKKRAEKFIKQHNLEDI
ncbi:hypothetical protein B9G39_21580 [Zooshikella ganghwensis]|uniref:Uncharacterized protein n=2 Tax=Zooshikella ganghwensis TaxID=202772 RepID=A0A4V1IP33_9GAMM|nr:hypothetical protein B9G39_21580 [Zooshikella ganghwensis]